MTTTDNYGLKKPSGDDRVNVQDFNDNMDTLDSVVKAVSDSADRDVTWDDVLNKPSSMPASDVKAWAKANTKPNYTYSEVGADPAGSAMAAEQNANNYTDTQVEALEGEINGKLDSSEVGAANGVASLDSTGRVPTSQLPSYVDDVINGYRNPTDGLFYEEDTYETPISGNTGKIYIDLSTEKTYRWSGSIFVEISESLALGETSSTAYRGDRGKAAYDHSQLVSGNPHHVTASDVGLGNVPNVTTNNQEPTFTEASTRTNIASGETLAIILGKIKKFFSDLKTVAFTGSYNDLTDKPSIGGDSTAYGTCATAAATAAKVVSISASGWSRTVGCVIGVKYAETNTATNCTLNVNDSGAAQVWFNTAVATSGNTQYGYANRVTYYMWDGTYWVWLSQSTDFNTAPAVLTGSLAANATTLSFTNGNIKDGTRLDIYTSVYGVNPTSMVQSGTTLTLTFSSSHDAATIKVHCWN